MMGIIIGRNRAEYLEVRKKDIDKHGFITRRQFYKVYPDALIPCEIYHDGVWVRTESVVVFPENIPIPYHCLYPEYYANDARLASIDEEKLMSAKRGGWFAAVSGFKPAAILDWVPVVAIACIGLYLLAGWLGI